MTDEAKKAKAEYQKAYRAKNRVRIREYQRNWERNNKDKRREYQANYWQRKAEAVQNG